MATKEEEMTLKNALIAIMLSLAISTLGAWVNKSSNVMTPAQIEKSIDNRVVPLEKSFKKFQELNLSEHKDLKKSLANTVSKDELKFILRELDDIKKAQNAQNTLLIKILNKP